MTMVSRVKESCADLQSLRRKDIFARRFWYEGYGMFLTVGLDL